MKEPTSRPQLTEQDWNFTTEQQVPGNELVPCLLWEYLRESQTARRLVKDWCAWRGEKDYQAELWARMNKLTVKINHTLYIPDFITKAVLKFSALHKLENRPWQNLQECVKRELQESCESVNKPVYLAFAEQAGEMAYRVKHLAEKDIKAPDIGTLAPVYARAPLDIFKRDTEVEAICIVVDWGRYNNGEIKNEFTKLGKEIVKTRPEGIQPQTDKTKGKGRLTALRGKLNDLGVARLRREYRTSDTLRSQNRSAFDRITQRLKDKRSKAVQKRLDSAKARFMTNFHQALPFEPTTSPPLCCRYASNPTI